MSTNLQSLNQGGGSNVVDHIQGQVIHSAEIIALLESTGYELENVQVFEDVVTLLELQLMIQAMREIMGNYKLLSVSQNTHPSIHDHPTHHLGFARRIAGLSARFYNTSLGGKVHLSFGLERGSITRCMLPL